MAAADYTSLVQSIYISYFGRPADTFGLANFAAQLDALKAPTTVNGLTAAYKTNASLKLLIDSFGTSAESTALYGTDTVAFVSAIYANVLNRQADFDGLVFWVNAINSGTLTKGNASLAIMAGAINNTTPQGLLDAAVLANKVTIATNFTAAIDTGPELSAYVGNAAAATARDMLKTVTATTVPATFQATVDATLVALVNAASVGTTFTLTTAVTDVFAGTNLNDTFNASPATLNGFDAVDGGAGVDTLNLVDVTTGGTTSIAASVSIKNVESINITSAQAVTLNTAAFTGATKTVIQAVGAVQIDGAVGATVSTTAGAITIGATTAANGDIVAKTTGALNAVTITGGANISTTSDGAVSISKATGKVAVTTTATAADVLVKGGTTVSVTSAANAGASAAGITVGAAATIATDGTTGKQTISNLSSDATGDITISNMSVAGGVTTYGTAATHVFANGAKSVVISGAGATDITDVGSIALVPANGSTAVAGTSTLTTVSLTGISGATTIASNVLTSLALNSSNAAVTATVVGAHALTIAAAANTTGALVTDATATSVNLITTGTVANTIAVSAAKASSLTVGGDGTAFTMGALTLGSDGGVTATTIAVTGSVKANLSSMGAQAKLTSIDASANTGGVTATVGTATAFTGGTGADVVTVGATTKAIALGDGNDTAIVTVSALGTAGSIAGGAGTDTLSITGALAAAASLNNAFAGTVTGFETLSVTSAGVSGAEVINLDVLGGYNSVTTGGAVNSLSVQGMASGGTLKLTSDVGAGGSYTVGINGALASTTDVLNISLSKAGVLAAGSVTAANVESINIVTADSSGVGSLDTLSLTAAAAKSIVVSGSAGLSLSGTGNALTSVDASGITAGGFTFTSANLAAAASIKGSATGVNTIDFSAATTAAVTYTGGSAADVLIIGTKANVIDLGAGSNAVTGGATGNQTITGGAGTDSVIIGSGNNTVSLGNGANTFTATTGNNTYVGGTGVDTVSVGGGVNTITTGTGADVIIFTGVAANGNSYSTITDVHAGETITFFGVVGAATLNAAPIALAATAVFQDYLDAATSGARALNTGLSYFVFGGNTYIVEDRSDAATYQNGVDSVVKLVGIVDLSATYATLSGGVVTLA